MGIFRRIWSWITAMPQKGDRKWNPTLDPVDIKKLSQELNIKAEGQRLGFAGVPREGDQMLAAPEAAVVAKVEEKRTEYVAWGELRLSVLNQQLARKDITQDVNQAKMADNEFERLANVELSAYSSRLSTLAAEASARRDELDRFKKENRLERVANVRTKTAKVAVIVFAVALIGVEALFNMKFFAAGLTSGLLGGFVEAALAAAINVFISFAVGAFAIGNVHHVKPLRKTLGIASIVFVVCFICTIALGIAHYRDALTNDADDAMHMALKTFWASPLSLQEMHSWMLFLVSVSFGVIAVFDGYKLDDPYPGYGKTTYFASEALCAYDDEIEEMRQKLGHIKEQMLDRLERAAAHAETSVAVYKSLIGDKERARNDLTHAVAGAESTMHALLQEFRNENNIARGDRAPPAYFNTWPLLRELVMPNFDTAVDYNNLARQQALLSSFISEVEDIRARIQTAFTQRFDAFQSLDQQFTSSPVSSGRALSEERSLATDETSTAPEGTLERIS
jgi:hypothetical protein